MPFFFRVASFHVVEERCHFDGAPRLPDIVYDSSTGRAHACAETGRNVSYIQATVCIESEAREAVTQVSSGKDPVAAIECALRHALLQIFPQVQKYLLYWYKSTCCTGTKVHILTDEILRRYNRFTGIPKSLFPW